MENIHVSLRVRPLNEKEIKQSEKVAWEVVDQNTVQVMHENIVNQTSRNVLSNALSFSKQLSFCYDRCFDESASNKQVYETSVQSILKSSLNGVNGTIFMYGQSGSGKTYTMMGYEKKSNSANSSGFSSNPQLTIHNYSSNQLQQQRKRNSSSHANSLSPMNKTNNGSGNNFQEIDDIDFDRIKSNTPDDNKGILMLALQDFFDTIKRDEDKTYVVRCSYVEIYNDQIYDLLNPINKLNEILQVGLNQNKEFYIKGVTQESVSSLEEAYDVLKTGETNKHYAQTTMNHHSSRSHSIFKLYVQSISSALLKSCMPRKSANNNQVYRNVNNQDLLTKLSEHDSTLISTSELNFIDLAGSERVSNHSNLEEMLLFNSASKNQASSTNNRDHSPSDLIKDRVKEGQFINKSLFFLTQVISQIAEGKPLTHIPYRNSPLTKILKSSLGGNSRTMIILCITPVQSQFEQSYSTIRFGLNAKKIENKVRVNIQAKNNEEALQLLILDYEKKIRDLEIQRNDEKNRNGDLIKKLNELASQNSQIQQRLMNSNRKNIELSLTRTSNFNGEGVCQTCQKSNQNSSQKDCSKQVSQRNNNSVTQKSSKKQSKWVSEKQQELINEQTVHCDYVGVLFPTKNNITVSDVRSEVKRNWQDLVFDYEGRYAFHQYQIRNKQFASYLQMWDKVNANLEKVIEHHLKIYECAQNYKNSFKNYQGSLNTVVSKLNSKNTQNMNSSNNNSQFFIDLKNISQDELTNLENSIYKSLQQIIQEKYKRSIISNLMDNSLQINTLTSTEKSKFTNILNNNGKNSMEQSNEIVIQYPSSELQKKQIQDLNNHSTKVFNNGQQSISDQIDTSIEDIKRYLKENEAPKHSLNLIQNSIEQEREFINQLFFRNVDTKYLGGECNIDWSEADFKHLKFLVTKSTYSMLNIYNPPNNNEKEENEIKKQSFLTPKINKYNLTADFNKNILNNDDEGEGENLKRNKQSNILEVSNYKNNNNNSMNNINKNNNSSNVEEKLQYHQNPIPKEHEEEIQQNFEKLQNQSSFFDGYSTISNINSNYTPSNTSFNQNVISSQRLFNALSNGLNIIQSNSAITNNNPTLNNNNNIYSVNNNLNNYASLPSKTINHQGAISIHQSPTIQNFLSTKPLQNQENFIKSNQNMTLPQTQQTQIQSNNKFVNPTDIKVSQINEKHSIPQTITYQKNNHTELNSNIRQGEKTDYINYHDDYSNKNPLNSLKLNTNSVPDSNYSLNNLNMLESTKQNNIEGEMLIFKQNAYVHEVPQTYQSNHQRSQSVNEPSALYGNQQPSQKNNEINNSKYYLGSQGYHQNKLDQPTNQTYSLSIGGGSQLGDSNGLIPKGIQKTNQNFNQYSNNNYIQKNIVSSNEPAVNFSDKQTQEQHLAILLKKQEMAIQNQAEVISQQYIGSQQQHKRNYSLQSATANVVINLADNQSNPNDNSSSSQSKKNIADSLSKDTSTDYLTHKRTGNIQQTKNYQKLLGNICKGGQVINDGNERDNSYQNNNSNSNLFSNTSKTNLNQSSSRTNINANYNNTTSYKQNCQSAHVTPKKQGIKLNNTISIDIIQLQSNSQLGNKPLGNHNKSLCQTNNYPQSQNISINNYDNNNSSNRKQSNSLHQTKNDKQQSKQAFLPNTSNLINPHNNSINLSNNQTYTGYSQLNKNYINYDENHIQQILSKSNSKNNN